MVPRDKILSLGQKFVPGAPRNPRREAPWGSKRYTGLEIQKVRGGDKKKILSEIPDLPR